MPPLRFASKNNRLSKTEWMMLTVAAVIVGLMIFKWLSPASSESDEPRLTGEFRIDGPQGLPGPWRATPSSCVDGKERGFEGIAFGFDQGAVTEIRIDTTRPGDNFVEIRFADPAWRPYRVREAECEAVGGTIQRSNYVFNGRHMFRLEGNIRVDCPRHGIAGEAQFAGCLPHTAADLR